MGLQTVGCKGERPTEIIINKAGRLVGISIGSHVSFIYFPPQDRIKSPKLSPFQRLVVCPFQQVRCSLSQLPHGLRTTSSSCRSYFSSICRRLSLLTLYRPLNDQHREAPGKDEHSRDSYLPFLVVPIYWFIFMPCFALAKSLISIANTTTLGSHKTHVPTFYAPEPTAPRNLTGSPHHTSITAGREVVQEQPYPPLPSSNYSAKASSSASASSIAQLPLVSVWPDGLLARVELGDIHTPTSSQTLTSFDEDPPTELMLRRSDKKEVISR